MGKKIISYFIAYIFIFTLFACTKDTKYYDAIPFDCKVVIRVQGDQTKSGHDHCGKLLALIFGNQLNDKSGIDISKSVYIYETNDGSMGVCASVRSESDLESYLSEINAVELKQRKDCKFAMINHSYIIGYNDCAMLITGPVVASSEKHVTSRLARYLELNENNSVATADYFLDLNNSDDDISLYGKISFLPKQFAVPFLIGVPTGTSTDDVMMKAAVSIVDSTLVLNGLITSENIRIKQGIDNAMSLFRDFSGKDNLDNKGMVNVFVNIEGRTLIRLLESNKDLSNLMLSSKSKEKLSSLDGNIALRIVQKNDITNQDDYDVSIDELQAGSKDGSKYKIDLNLNGSSSNLLTNVIPFLGTIKKIQFISR